MADREAPEPVLDLFVPSSFPAGVRAGLVGRSRAARGGDGLSFSGEDAAPSREVLASHLGLEPGALVFARQVHGARVVAVPSSGAPAGAGPGEADGLVSSRRGLALCLAVADCCAVLVCDPVRLAVGAFHAGWRGARDGIVRAGVDAMERSFGSRPEDLLAWLSPCASGERYEVGEEVALLFPRSVRSVRTQDGTRLYLDLRAELDLQLREAGLRGTAVERSAVCSIADPRCHSHRREGASAGRMAAFILLDLPDRPGA